MNWILAAILIVFGAFVLASLLRRPEKNVDRDAFGHWIESLMRYYEDSSSLVIVDKNAQIILRYIRSETRGDGCRLLLGVGGTPLAVRHAEELRRECEKEYDLVGEEELGSGAVAGGFIDVHNIWATGAGSRCARVAHGALDVMGIAPEAHFDLTFKGKRSVERTAQARERLSM